MDRYLLADQTAISAGLTKSYLTTETFDLLTYTRLSGQSGDLVLYLEGDGSAWRSRRKLSTDPTPRSTLVLDLAGMDPSTNLAYLARPCQYVIKSGYGRNCEKAYWSTSRFAEEIVASVDQAISELKEKAGAERVHLVGYSGGGAVAALVAARRIDVASLRTVAGNLDHELFTREHRVTPLNGSLNPVDIAKQIRALPQIHYVGTEDEVVPGLIAEQFVRRQGEGACSAVVTVDGASHLEGWQAVWPDLLGKPLPCTP